MWDVIIIPADTNLPMEKRRIPDDLEAVRKIVGGYVEHVRIGDVTTSPPTAFEGVGMFVDEDGIAHGQSQNDRAAILYGVTVHGQGIYGTAVLIGEASDPEEGRVFVNLPEKYSSVAFWINHCINVVAQVTEV